MLKNQEYPIEGMCQIDFNRRYTVILSVGQCILNGDGLSEAPKASLLRRYERSMSG